MSEDTPAAKSRFSLLSSAWLDIAACLFVSGVGVLAGLRYLSDTNGVLTVGDDEVAIVYDNWSGASRQVDTPGKRFYLPFLQDVRVLKRSPAQMVLSGGSRTSCVEVPELSIRARDGSSFRFEHFTLQFALLPDQAGKCLEDSRADLKLAAGVVESFVRAILRDEYGRFTTADVVLHESLKAANAASRMRLERALAPHGLQIVELSTPKPRFDPKHEEAVERRKVANQEVERLKTKFMQLEAERDEALARLEKDKEQELTKLQLSIGEYRAQALKDSLTQRAEAERYIANRRSDGETRRFEQEQQALALTDQHTVAAAALQARVDETELRGEAAVRAAWIERLAQIPFRVAPYTRDASPRAIELTETAMLGINKKGH